LAARLINDAVKSRTCEIMQSRPFLALWLLVLCSACHARETITGPAHVTDGDSLEIGSARIRLFGIDAPEGRQPCRDASGAAWRCGDRAAAKLRELIGSSDVTCTRVDTDQYDRAVSLCKAAGTDLNAAMVAAGFALAYRHYSSDYVHDEDEAHAAKRGLWSGTFEAPWDYRRGNHGAESVAASERNENAAPSRERCNIKGNINREGERIYHVPGSRSYEATRIDESRGERWFCSEAEALKAGWRAPRSR
jgi:endonuclease YncB( thermonuclease family)